MVKIGGQNETPVLEAERLDDFVPVGGIDDASEIAKQHFPLLSRSSLAQGTMWPNMSYSQQKIFGLERAKVRRVRDESKSGKKLEESVKKEHSRINNMDDEYHTIPAVEIKILHSANLNPHEQLTSDMEDVMAKEYQYLSSTSQLETETPRLKIIKDYVEKMVEGDKRWEGNIRVVIMNKGKEPRAFVYPDGTIFISQSLINLYDSIDEVMAIVGHEVALRI